MVIGIITILALVVSLVLLVIIANQAAKNKWQASFTPSGHMEFVVAGEKPIRTLLNVEGYYLHRGDGEFVIRVGEVVKDETEEFVIPRDNENPEEVLKLPKIEGRPTQVPVVNAILPINDVLDPEKHSEKPEEEQKFQEERREIEKERKRRRKKLGPSFLQRKYGFYWVSWIWPLRKLHKFDVPKVKLLEPTTLGGDNHIENLIQREEDLKDTTAFLWQFPRPIIVKAVEFADFFQADIVVQSILQVVMPWKPVFVLHPDNMFANLSASIRSAVVDFCRQLTLRQFIRLFRTGYGGEQFYLRAFSRINTHAEKAPRGTIEEFGVWVRNAWIQEIIPIKEAEEVMEALRANEIALREGQARLTRAKYEAEAVRVEGQGKADALRLQRDAAGVDVLMTQLQVERVRALENTSVTTYVEGGASAGIMVGTQAAPPPPPKKEKGSESETGEEEKKS
ncbi:MAG: hypothetical protein A3G59_03325 [Candidatus Taylorbacteria bacterium RIFCSPLOWO2_12_FULL_47_20]|uniref:Band 7 domain-containing protein n=2 Tax=Candidatus Tayloriibacteriota TaxID=1817919 RepID=A0A1G2P6N8_9BACT|nr:MAG: hypothetical protein A3H68_03360 [Candidatus Taylorbacteria bacterium RIFCSPLOWO2_02_FULL_46_40]OHA43997.1 MAG: hypothetical protein A3G59_03325 [Candidatus Taylorbacteria bacterium RIFCSPLOWO2_12_FULL_47_20]